MAVTFDSQNTGAISGAAALTIPITISGGSGGAVVVSATCLNSTDYLAAGTATVGGVSMGAPVLTPAAGAANTHQYTWVLRSPPVGAVNAVITPSNAAAYLDGLVSSYLDVHATDPIVLGAAFVGVSGSSLTRSIATPVGGMAVDMLTYRVTGQTLTPHASQTRIGAAAVAGGVSTSSGSYKAGAADMTWTIAAGGGIAHHVIALPPAATGPALSGAVTLDAVLPAGSLADAGSSGLSGAVALDAVVVAGDLGQPLGVITTGPVHWPLTGLRADNQALAWVSALRLSDGVQVAVLTGQVTNGVGVLQVTHGGLVPGTQYVLVLSDGTVAGCGTYLAG